MAAAYSVGPIESDQVDKAYRLVEVIGYDIDLGGWREYCSNAIHRNRYPGFEDIVTVENPLGYITGLSIMRAGYSRVHGRVLDVPVFVVISAGDTAGVCDALLAYAMAAARSKHCGVIRVASLEPASWPTSPGRRGRERGLLIPVR